MSVTHREEVRAREGSKPSFPVGFYSRQVSGTHLSLETTIAFNTPLQQGTIPLGHSTEAKRERLWKHIGMSSGPALPFTSVTWGQGQLCESLCLSFLTYKYDKKGLLTGLSKNDARVVCSPGLAHSKCLKNVSYYSSNYYYCF